MGQIVFSMQLVMIPWNNKMFHFSAQERHEYVMQSKKIQFTVSKNLWVASGSLSHVVLGELMNQLGSHGSRILENLRELESLLVWDNLSAL